MKRVYFIKYLVPSLWAFQACVKQDIAQDQPKIMANVSLRFPTQPNTFIAGAINPVKFTISPLQEVDVYLYNKSKTTVLGKAKGMDEVWIAIPDGAAEYILEIHKTKFEIKSTVAEGQAVSIKQYETQFNQGNTVAIIQTNDIPFAIKRISQDTFVAFDMTCTHSGCLTDLQTNNHFACGCHGSTFDANGKVSNGPALDNLRLFPYSVLSEHLIVVVQNK